MGYSSDIGQYLKKSSNIHARKNVVQQLMVFQNGIFAKLGLLQIWIDFEYLITVYTPYNSNLENIKRYVLCMTLKSQSGEYF
jgi:hypothetical protein